MSCEITKAPASVLDVGVVWTSWLNSGDTIVSSVWESSDAELVVSIEMNDTVSSSCYIGGGVKGKQYKLTNRITTANGLVDERYILVYINEIAAGC